MLYYETQPNVFQPWHGEPIENIRYPSNIETLWSDAELAEVGLYAPVDPGVPDGKIVTETSVARVSGVVTFVYTLADAPAPVAADFHLTKRQICAALIAGGVSLDPDSWMRALLANIADPVVRALALNDWSNAPYYDRGNALFSNTALMSAAGMTSAQIDAIWLVAKDLPA